MAPGEAVLVMAGAAGTYREFPPAVALEDHFQCVWSNTLALVDDERVAVVPDGCVDITWIDGELSVAGPDVVAAVSPIVPGSTVIGIRFLPGAARLWLGLSMSEIVGARVALGKFWGARAREIAARIGDAESTAERIRVLEAALSRLAPDLDPPRSDMGFVFNALRTESAGPGMAIILDRLDISPRTLRRRCQEAFGYGPKTLDRILRFSASSALRGSERSRASPISPSRRDTPIKRTSRERFGACRASPPQWFSRSSAADWPFRSRRLPSPPPSVGPPLKGGEHDRLSIPHDCGVDRS